MLIALDKNSNRVDIDSVKNGEEYFCPACGQKMLQKRGEIKIHHFAHFPNCKCTDLWSYDFSDWHYRWIKVFPQISREVLITCNNEKHRCDVLVEKKNAVILFQKEHITKNQFNEKNKFFHQAGYKVIWLLDFSKEYQDKTIYSFPNYERIFWDKPKQFLKDFDPKNDDIQIFLQLAYGSRLNLAINGVTSNYESLIVKIDELDEDEGLKSFKTDIKYNNLEFFLYVNGNDLTSGNRIRYLYDELLPIRNKDHTTFLYGCSKTKDHYCVDSNEIDNYLDDEASCERCPFFKNDGPNDFRCNKRVLDLRINRNYEVIDIKRNSFGLIQSIIYLDNNGQKITKKLSFVPDPGDTIFNLWNEVKPKTAIFYNFKRKIYAIVTKNPNEQYIKYHKVYGYIVKNKYLRANESSQIYDVNSKDWILTSFK